MTSTISARRMPTLSLAENVTGSSPERVAGREQPLLGVEVGELGRRAESEIVTREP